MLVLTRKAGESIHIGEGIILKVSSVDGNRVKLCIDAPKSIRILRGEVAEQIEAEAARRDDSSTRNRSERPSYQPSRVPSMAK